MSIVTNLARSVKVELIAKLAASYEAFDGGTVIRGVGPHNLRDYFRKYGSGARSFEHIADGNVYIGHVRISGRREFLSAIVAAGESAVAVSFDTEVVDSSDFATLMANKRDFMDKMKLALDQAAELARKSSASPQPPRPNKTNNIDPSSQGLVSKNQDWIGWVSILIAGAILGAVFLVPIMREMNNPASVTAQQDQAGYYPMPNNPYEGMSETGPVSEPLSGPAKEPLTNSVTDEDVPTVGLMADTVTSSVSDFLAALKQGGMTGAAAKSIECHNGARASQRIIDTDKCAAFDFAARYFDESVTIANGWPSTPYFANRDPEIREAYSRFPSYSEMRLSIIRSQAIGALQELRPTAID